MRVAGTTDILVVETETEGDDSNRNRAKFRDGRKHFETLKAQLESAGEPWCHHFYFLSPEDYTQFLGAVKEHNYAWHSGLMQELGS